MLEHLKELQVELISGKEAPKAIPWNMLITEAVSARPSGFQKKGKKEIYLKSPMINSGFAKFGNG